MPHTQISLALREPLALDGSRPQCEPGFRGSQCWENKKKTSNMVTNAELEKTIDFAMQNGAEAVKVSGAGGGGFLLLYCNPQNRQRLTDALKTLDGSVYSVKFTRSGAESWIIL